MNDPLPASRPPNATPGPRSQLGLYRAWLTSPEHRRHITVGRSDMLRDTLDTLRRNLGKKPKHHQLFIAPRGSGKTHFLSLIEDEIQRDPELSAGYHVVRFPEEANRIGSFADFLLAITEILSPEGAPWADLHQRLATETDDDIVCDTLVKALRTHYRETRRVFLLMVENLHQIMEEQMKKPQAIQALRGFLMGDNGCLLMATSPVHFGAHTKPDAPFYDFFDTQVLTALSPDDTVEMIRRNLEWDRRTDLLARFDELRPRLLAIHTMTGGSPRLTVMLYELLSTESVTAVRDQFLLLQDRITPFYQDRMRDLAPQERAVLETIATLRDSSRPENRKTPANIARLMRMSQPQVSSLLQRLSKGLYLVAQPNPDDKRSTLYTIREGFFDLWLAMNLNRASARRIPLLSDFFAAFYQRDEERRKKREEYWQRLRAGEFNPDTTENLSYLSTVGEAHEQAAEKIKLIPALHHLGDTGATHLLKDELRRLPLDPTGRWLADHADTLPLNPLDEIAALIECWQTRREGNLEAFAARLNAMSAEPDFRAWSQLKIDFLRDHIEIVPLTAERLETRLQLAKILRDLARWQEAEQQNTLALTEAETLGEEPHLAWALNDFALLLKATNRVPAAEPLIRRALVMAEARYGKNHPLVALRLNNLARLLQDTNRLQEAEPLMRQALSIVEASYGGEHPIVAVGLNNLASLLFAKRCLQEAEPLMRRALAIDEASSGEEHPKVAIRLNNLASLLQATNRLQDAEPLLRRALSIAEASYGEDHPMVATSQNNLAQLLQAKKDFQQAEPLLRKALAIDETNYGKEHPEVARDQNNLALLFQATNRLTDAEPLLRRALEILAACSRTTGHGHPHLETAIRNYRSVLNALGKTEAEIAQAVAEQLQGFPV